MTLIGGVDEVGYGSFAGPIISVIAVFDDKRISRLPSGIRDSKKLSPAKRRGLELSILDCATDVGYGISYPWEIDEDTYGSLQNSYTRAINEILPINLPEVIYMDGINRINSWQRNQVVEAKADDKYVQVACASILAKVYRDRLMEELDLKYPVYNWKGNKGYGTSDHIQAIWKHGLVLDRNNKHDGYIHRLKYCQNSIRKKPK